MGKALAVGAGILLISALHFDDARAQGGKAGRNASPASSPKISKPRRRAARKSPPAPAPCSLSSLCGPDIPLPTNIKEYYDPAAVQVLVAIDEQGMVTSAKVISGDPSLRSRAVEAALRKRYRPKIISGRAVKVDGVITYKFDISSNPAKGPYEYRRDGITLREVSSEGSGPE